MKLLSALTVVFLPLSLTSSLLSMQICLANLHFLLYDFCAVIILLGTIVGIVLVLRNLTERLKDKLYRTERSPQLRKWYPLFKFGTTGWGFIIWGLLILSSFLVGMVKNVGLGLKILG